MEDAPTAAAGLSAHELDAYRQQADRFLGEIDEEYYLNYAGLKETLELEPIYARHAELTTLERARAIGDAVDGNVRVRELWRFACESHLGDLTREHAERLATLEAELKATVDGESIPFRMLRPTLANEPDRARRRRLDEIRRRLTEEHLNPVHIEAAEVLREAVRLLGAPTYLELYRRFGFPLDDLGAQCQAVLDATERLWEEAGDRLFRERIGVPLTEAERWDTPRVFRASDWDRAFTRDAMVPALEGTLADLGIDLRAQRNVELDLDDRPSKTSRAYCFAIEIPDRIVLMIKPIGGPADWRLLFHEAGHAEHFAHTSPDLPVEARRLGDDAVTEGWAALLQHLVDDPAWLARRLDVPRPDAFASQGAAEDLFYLRRYCAKLLYEIELQSTDDVPSMRSRYRELLGDALRIDPQGTDYLTDVDSGFYASSYLRSWAFEAQLRTFLREEFGTSWFTRREAGGLLRDLWSEGQRLSADELLRDVAASELELEAAADSIRAAIR